MINSGSLASFDGLWPEPAPVVREQAAPAFGADVIRTMSVRPAVVEGWVAAGTVWSPGTRLPLDGLGVLVFQAPWRPTLCSGLPGWRASGRLLRRGRFGWAPGRAFGRVDVEILPWSRTTTGLRLARRSPLPVHWSARRVRGYWATAHAAADRLAGLDLQVPAQETGQLVGRRG
jgi:hypothetical protein